MYFLFFNLSIVKVASIFTKRNNIKRKISTSSVTLPVAGMFPKKIGNFSNVVADNLNFFKGIFQVIFQLLRLRLKRLRVVVISLRILVLHQLLLILRIQSYPACLFEPSVFFFKNYPPTSAFNLIDHNNRALRKITDNIRMTRPS